MRALFDVNVLIALLDSHHSLHQRARHWVESNIRAGWASCPITQNGYVRIVSGAGYANPLAPADALGRLASACADRHHQFWPDDISSLDTRLIDWQRIYGSRQLTDVYLLALAVKHGGRLVTLDSNIAIDAVHGAKSQHLLKL
jgi:toxin-antitoxin system PIN domain toxin